MGSCWVWNETVAAALASRRVLEREAVRVLAVLSVALMDSALACWDAKYHCWYMRPSHRDPSLTALPDMTADIRRLADEVAESRLYAALH